MKKTWLIPLLLVGMLAGCANGEGTEGGQTGGGTGGDTGGETEHGGDTNVVALPLTFDANDEFAEGKGWEYVPNNPEYPDPKFYGEPKGLKLNFPGMGIKSSAFAATGSLKVTLNINKLNSNEKPEKPDVLNVFEVEGYNAAGTKVATAGIAKTEFTSKDASEYTVTLTGEAMTSVRIMFVDYPTVGGARNNINFAGAVVAKQ